jgi:hypothetical protein
LVARHPDYSTKKQGVIDYQVVNTGGFSFMLVKADGSSDSISIHACLTGTSKTKSLEACRHIAVRNAVQPDINAVKAKWPPGVICHLCQKPAQDVQADHAGNMPFVELSKHILANLTQQGMPTPAVVKDDNASIYKLKFDSLEYVDAVRKLHVKLSCIKPACAECNRRAGGSKH